MTTASTTVITPMATIDGKLYPLTECTWVMFEPCGCASGVHLAEHAPPSEDEVWKSFTVYETAREVASEKAAGASLRLMLSTAIREGGAASLLMTLGNCAHEPKWGRAPLPDLPAGHVWALLGYQGRAAHVKHGVALGEPFYVGAWGVAGKALCGAGRSARTAWYADTENAWKHVRPAELISDALPCSTCLAKLAKLPAAEVSA